MGHVIDFAAEAASRGATDRRPSSSATSMPENTAEILLFTGVRYERYEASQGHKLVAKDPKASTSSQNAPRKKRQR